MTTYAWVGRTRNGQLVKGERTAESEDALGALLKREQILVTKISAAAKKEERYRRISARSLAIFTRQFSVMVDAGLPLVQCLELQAVCLVVYGFAVFAMHRYALRRVFVNGG